MRKNFPCGLTSSAIGRVVFRRERGAKGIEIGGEYLDSPGLECTQVLLALKNVQRCAALGTGFGEHQSAMGKIESYQTLTSRQLCPRAPPVQTPCNHQVE